MQLVQAHFVARPQNYGTSRNNVLTICSNVLTLLTTFFAAVEEGFYMAAQYETLARKSDELAALGLSRDDLPRFVMFGKK